MPGLPVLTLTSEPFTGPGFTTATVLPSRGMMLAQARLRLPTGEVIDGLEAPPLHELERRLAEDDFAGNASFRFGGAVLAPFANRIRGRALPGRELEATIDGRVVRLPLNWGGKAPGAEQYAMHGLILGEPVTAEQPSPDRIVGRLEAGDFGGRWPARTTLSFEWSLTAGVLELSVRAQNAGARPLPIGIGWHPYFALPSGRRDQARLRLAAGQRVEVNNYDEVLPTGGLLPTAGGPYDFGEAPALGDLYLDDCFTDLRGEAAAEVLDPAAGVGLRIASPGPFVKAFQVYAPPDRAFVVVEPQFNLADPYGSVWPVDLDTGMVQVAPGDSITYRATVAAFTLGNPR